MSQRLRMFLAVAAVTLAVGCESSTGPSSLPAATHTLTIIPNAECPPLPTTPSELWRVRMKAVQVKNDTIEAITADPPLYWPTISVRLYASSPQLGQFIGEIGGSNRISTIGWGLTLEGSPGPGLFGVTDGRLAALRAEGSLATTIRGTWDGSVSLNIPDGTSSVCDRPPHQFVLEHL